MENSKTLFSNYFFMIFITAIIIASSNSSRFLILNEEYSETNMNGYKYFQFPINNEQVKDFLIISLKALDTTNPDLYVSRVTIKC